MNEVEQAIAIFETGLETLETSMTYVGLELSENEMNYMGATKVALEVMKKELARERGWGCAYCVIGRRSPDARYCSNCGRKLTPALPELANESEEVNPDSHQYVDNDSTNRRKSVKQKCRNLHSETDIDAYDTAITALRGPQPDPETGLVPCGCGGKAILFHQPDIEGPGSDGDRWAVFCEKTCGMETSDMTSREYAVETWNTAMGWKGGAE